MGDGAHDEGDDKAGDDSAYEGRVMGHGWLSILSPDTVGLVRRIDYTTSVRFEPVENELHGSRQARTERT
jgi:hypothetical protein